MAKISLTKSHLGKSVSISKDDTVLVELPENPTTGYKWILEEDSDLNVSASFISRLENVPGSTGLVRFEIKSSSDRSGKRITFLLKRPWETEAGDRFWFDLNVG